MRTWPLFALLLCACGSGGGGGYRYFTDGGDSDGGGGDFSFPPGSDLAGLPHDMAVAASCGNGMKDGTETDTDCGGACNPCPVGKACGGPKDCQSALCVNQTCAAASCEDGAKNQTRPTPTAAA
ncbi:MAG: hypothetical protein EXR72_07220 [Myxococcales bacterium]|nr:hypothetical protein [Myxococcales bacterium]